MKYLLIMHNNPAVLSKLNEDQMKEIGDGHQRFIDAVRASGELIDSVALAQPTESAVVRVRDGAKVVTDGPYIESKEFLGGYYLLECASQERAHELAATIPDADIDGMGVEVRPVIFFFGSDN